MYIGYTPEQEALRQELRNYYGRLLTRDVEQELLRRLIAGLFTTEETLFLLGEPGVD